MPLHTADVPKLNLGKKTTVRPSGLALTNTEAAAASMMVTKEDSPKMVVLGAAGEAAGDHRYWAPFPDGAMGPGSDPAGIRFPA
jgi:hypothetical protein